jgi:hypothetical protein
MISIIRLIGTFIPFFRSRHKRMSCRLVVREPFKLSLSIKNVFASGVVITPLCNLELEIR